MKATADQETLARGIKILDEQRIRNSWTTDGNKDFEVASSSTGAALKYTQCIRSSLNLAIRWSYSLLIDGDLSVWKLQIVSSSPCFECLEHAAIVQLSRLLFSRWRLWQVRSVRLRCTEKIEVKFIWQIDSSNAPETVCVNPPQLLSGPRVASSYARQRCKHFFLSWGSNPCKKLRMLAVRRIGIRCCQMLLSRWSYEDWKWKLRCPEMYQVASEANLLQLLTTLS